LKKPLSSVIALKRFENACFLNPDLTISHISP
jgi:hypothetical protein